MSDKITTSLTTLITGFLVVFSVLLLLIMIIKIYGTIVYSVQTKSKQKKSNNQPSASDAPDNAITQSADLQPVLDNISGEVVAAIAAAVDYIYGPQKVAVKSIKKSDSRRKIWHNAGVMHNTRPF